MQIVKTLPLIVALLLVLQHGVAQPAPWPARMNDEDAYTFYTIYSDAQSIYIKLYIADSLQKAKVLKNGMEVWIDVKGKKNKATGILFPLSAGGNGLLGGGDRAAADGPRPFFTGGTGLRGKDTSLPELVAKRQEVELKGFAGGINGTKSIAALPLPGFGVALRLARDTLVYEATVPFAALADKPADGKPVSIGIVEKGVELPGFGDMGGPDGGGPPGGGDAGPPPGPPPGDMQEGGGVDLRRLLETNVIWYKLKLHA